MLRPRSRMFAVTPKIILLLAFLCLMITAIFGLLSSYRVDSLRADVTKANAARDAAEHRRVAQEMELKNREMAVAGEEAKIAEADDRVAKISAELAQLQKEKTELQTKLEEKQNEIASLQKRIEEAGPAAKPSGRPGAAPRPEKQPISPAPQEIKPQSVGETTPPPRRPKRPKTAPSTPPQVADNAAAVSTSSVKALAIYAPRPSYPREARSRHITGSGVCVVSVDRGNGSVTEASMTESTGDTTLDDSAVSTFRTWRFKPGTVSKVRIPFEFTNSRVSFY